MPPIIQKLLALKNPVRAFRVFRGLFYKFWYKNRETVKAKAFAVSLFVSTTYFFQNSKEPLV